MMMIQKKKEVGAVVSAFKIQRMVAIDQFPSHYYSLNNTGNTCTGKS